MDLAGLAVNITERIRKLSFYCKIYLQYFLLKIINYFFFDTRVSSLGLEIPNSFEACDLLPPTFSKT